MPPAIEDLEGELSGSEEEIAPNNSKSTKEEPVDDDDEDEDEDDEGDPQEYVVEKIHSHGFDDSGEISYQVEWLGFKSKKDYTWEPEDNLSTAQDALQEYFRRIGGRPTLTNPRLEKEKEKKTNRKRGASTHDSPAANGRKKRGKTNSQEATPSTEESMVKTKPELPVGSWETAINFVETIEEIPDPDSKTGEMRRMAFVYWTDGKRSQHPLQVLYQKAPQKMLLYYEQHLIFKSHREEED